MNSLDDAIKEHLELKRKRGAPSHEVERLEREAFGSAQGVEETEVAPPHDAEEAGGGPPEASGEPPAEASAEEAPEASDPPAPALAEEPVPVREGQEEDGGYDDEGVEPFELDDIFTPEDSEARGEEPEAAGASAGSTALQPTEEYPAPLPAEGEGEEWHEPEGVDEAEEPESLGGFEPAVGDTSEEWVVPHAEEDEEDEPFATADPVTDGEDLLEETPEFLKESPQEDELWFEQSPPKDFDFDD